ncbi:helix-turn-helix domain-containing protein [Spirulina subsalsa FACHB-351]|uniref:Helix-turn-helix domain-containing protein n=1 Tax=Spirulina subsalsa FACHB-351 TaxID=234711 RepID=A0ABT3L6B6_9CYAN|nr:helix-turn-helix domain-containing protein [Spirulina subsalsa FACHB-351]
MYPTTQQQRSLAQRFGCL